MSRRAATGVAVAIGAGIPAGWFQYTFGREDFGNLPTGLVVVMVAAWVAFGFTVRRWSAVAIAVLTGLCMLVAMQLLEGPPPGDAGPTGAILLVVLLPGVAACVAAGVLLHRAMRKRDARIS